MSKENNADLDEVELPPEFVEFLLDLIWSDLLNGKPKEKPDRDNGEGAA